MAYSVDFREAALAAIDAGMSKWKVHKTFKISRTSLDDWLKLRETTGDLKDANYHHGPKPMISDTPENHTFFEKHNYKTLTQLCDVWFEKTGQRMTTVSMSRSLKRLGYSRKKRAIVIKNEMN